MSNGTTVTCPRCGTPFGIGITFSAVTIQGAAMNAAVTCPRCDLTFDATGGGDGTFSTVGGQLRRVADAARSVRNAMAHARPDEVEQLRELLELLEHRDAATAEAVQEALELNPGRFPRFEEWAARNPALLNVLVAGALPVLLFILTMLAQQSQAVVDGDATSPPRTVTVFDDEVLERLVREVLSGEVPAAPLVGPPTQVEQREIGTDPREADRGDDGQVP